MLPEVAELSFPALRGAQTTLPGSGNRPQPRADIQKCSLCQAAESSCISSEPEHDGLGKMRNWELLVDIQDLPHRLLPKLLYEADLIPVPDAIPEQRDSWYMPVSQEKQPVKPYSFIFPTDRWTPTITCWVLLEDTLKFSLGYAGHASTEGSAHLPLTATIP